MQITIPGLLQFPTAVCTAENFEERPPAPYVLNYVTYDTQPLVPIRKKDNDKENMWLMGPPYLFAFVLLQKRVNP